MIAVNYEYYKETFGGMSITEERFPFVLRKANYLLSDLTLGRADNVTEDDDLAERVKDCLCAMCDGIEQVSKVQSQGGIKTSETVAKWSVSYDTSKVAKTEEQACLKALDLYLGGTKLTCRFI